MRRFTPLLAMACVAVLAAEREGPPPSAYYEQQQQRRPPPDSKPLRFHAPPSQLLEPWRCSGGNVYARPPSATPCGYDPRLAPDFVLDYPFASLRLMPPMRPVPPPIPSGEPVPGAPPSQLPKATDPTNPYFFFER